MARREASKATNSKSPATTGAVPRRRGLGRTIWLVATGLFVGVAGGAFAVRMLVPPGEPEPAKRRNLERDVVPPASGVTSTEGSQPEELLVPQAEPVEISTRMRPGEWTEESLQEHIEDYRQQIREMGAAESQIVTNVERTEGGAVRVAVSWDRNRA